MDSNVYTDPAIVQEAQNVVPLKVNVDTFPDLAGRYKVEALPSIVWIDNGGNERGRQAGAVSAAELLPLMQRYR